MGGKRSRKRQHLFIYIAGLIGFLFILSSCAPVQKITPGRYNIDRAEQLMQEGDFSEALREYEAVLKNDPNQFGDRVLYRIGMIYAHPGNSSGDDEKARESFQGILDKYPESPLREEAGLWVLKLGKMLDIMKEQLELNRKLSILKNELKDKENNIIQLEGRTKILESQIKDLKKIDLGIEGKKGR